MRRSRSPSSPSPYRALAHHKHDVSKPIDNVSLIRSFNNENNPTRPLRPSRLTASIIRDMPQDLVDRIRSFPLFMSAPDEFLVEIGNNLKPQIHAMNDHVINEGDDAKAMYWLVRGVVAVTSRDGEAVYAELKPGAFFGEIGVLMDMPRTATIIARTKCLLLVLKKEDLQAVMPKFPDMEKAVRQEAQERLNLLKKLRKETGSNAQPPSGDISSRSAPSGDGLSGDLGIMRDASATTNSKKRKSPSPGLIEDPAAGSAIGSGFVNIRQTLKELPLFSSLPPDVLHFLGLSAQPRAYPPFSDIVRQGTLGNEIYFIVRGEAEVIHEPPKDLHECLDSLRIQKRPRLKAGQYFGEVTSLGLSKGRTATVRSITTVECLMIPGDTLDELWSKCSPDIKSQVEETARNRFSKPDGDVEMTDADADARPRASSDPSTPTTPTTPHRPSPHVTFTTPSKPGSPTREDHETSEPKDPDPFLSVSMENIRNRRRHSLAPAIPQAEASSPLANGIRPHHIDTTMGMFPVTETPETPSDIDIPAKRVKTLPRRPVKNTKPALPDDILIRAFQLLDIGVLMRLRRVCSHWKHILHTSEDVCHNVNLSIYNRRITDSVITDVLVPFIGTRAQSVDLSNCFHVSDDGFSTLWHACGKNVKTWKMRSVWDVSAGQILEMSENARGLEEIDWSNCRKVGDNLLGRVVGWVVPEQQPNSRQVVIQHSSSRPKTRHQQKQQQAQQQQQKNAGSAPTPAPGTVIGCPKLHSLNLSYCKHITDRSMAHLAHHASNRLLSLSLTRCTSISDAGFQAWAPFKFEKLWNLCLADCTYLSDNAIVALVNSAKNLTHLDLSFCCALSDTATEVVAIGLPRLKELRLAFCGSAVSDASLESVALHLNDLEGISVRGCVRVTGKGVENILRGCDRLKWIDASQCRNLEPWIRMGGVERWGYDNRTGKPAANFGGERQSSNGVSSSEPPMPNPMSVLTLTTPRYLSYPTMMMGKRKRKPVRFLIEKGPKGLR